ncbi:hypothetical protein JHK87_029125 [Glycine soja]|nr:hypothetical protein JHK87_029125 [Glycine soja]
MSQTLGLGGVIPRFVNRSWLRNLTVRAMALSSSSDHGDQTRGGLPRFYSETLPPSKALSSSFSLLLSQLFNNTTNHITPQFHMKFIRTNGWMPQLLGTSFGGIAACIFWYLVTVFRYKHKALVD